ncbi:ECF transporter S component [Liquorilactobacillus satsumensis]|uniref:ECF transporter S component n=1 Tax=Liquorilactobacillus satsumensis TaxID=259059 RepID=UPI0021C314A3|nr:ECF transporter S component [Liquorilactobacillus satsumensis]MCP9312257.1 ECF transporter S component [Liquorilactobacillus satsumensis]MCP9359536.1 ECF transporter S component [Liquorilactobacillus satsumensis]
MKQNGLKRVILLAILIAVNVVIARIFLIPLPMTHGNINLCDAGIFIAALLLGRSAGALVGGLSGLLLDLISGFPQYMLFSLVVHGLEGYLAGRIGERATKYSAWIGLFVGIVVMVGGYLLSDSLMYTFATGIVGVPLNIVQGFAGAFVALPVYYRLGSRVFSSR